MNGTMFNVCKNTQLPEKCLFMSLVYENARLCETLYVCKGSVFYVPKTQEVDSTSIKYTHKKLFIQIAGPQNIQHNLLNETNENNILHICHFLSHSCLKGVPEEI